MVDFLILGNSNAVIYKDIFNLIKNQKLRLGVTLFCGTMPTFMYNNEKPTKVNSCAWFTTLKHTRVNKFLDFKKFDESSYYLYDNYNVINVDKTEDIPDYDGVIGVPITFLDKWNPEQFDIVGFFRPKIDGKKKYVRLIIRRKSS